MNPALVNIWRNGKTKKIPLLKSILLYIWLIPAVPIETLRLAPDLDYTYNLLQRHPVYILTDLLTWNLTLSWILLSSVGAILWLITVKALTTPTLVLFEDTIVFYGYGFFPEKLSAHSLAKIHPYSLGPLGTLFDFKSTSGTNFRVFGLLAKINKAVLQECVAKYGIKVI